jgi:hypothetical protein
MCLISSTFDNLGLVPCADFELKFNVSILSFSNLNSKLQLFNITVAYIGTIFEAKSSKNLIKTPSAKNISSANNLIIFNYLL